MNHHYLEEMKLTPYVCVIDIETLGKSLDATIATIGCVIKDVFTGQMLGVFYVRCDTHEQRDYRSIDDDTLAFWEAQRITYQVAYNEVFNLYAQPREKLSDALRSLNEFIHSHIDYRPKVMGNGPEFDNAILEHAMAHFSIKPAWDHGCNQSLRTVVLMGRLLLGFDPKYNVSTHGNKHHALDDAIYEADYLHAIFKRFMEQLQPPQPVTFAISQSHLSSLLELFELDNTESVNPDSGKAHRAIVELFFEEFNLVAEV